MKAYCNGILLDVQKFLLITNNVTKAFPVAGLTFRTPPWGGVLIDTDVSVNDIRDRSYEGNAVRRKVYVRPCMKVFGAYAVGNDMLLATSDEENVNVDAVRGVAGYKFPPLNTVHVPVTVTEDE